MRYGWIGIGVITGLGSIVLAVVALPAWIAGSALRELTAAKGPSSDVILCVTAVKCHWRYEYTTPSGRFEIDPAETPCTTETCRMGLDPGKAAVLPVGKTVTVVVGSLAEDICDLALPALGIRKKAIPGRVEETSVNASKPGLYNDQIAGTCRNDPSRIGIGIRAVDAREWTQWLARYVSTERRDRPD